MDGNRLRPWIPNRENEMNWADVVNDHFQDLLIVIVLDVIVIGAKK